MEETIVAIFQNQIKKYGDRVIMRRKREGKWINISWREFGQKVKDFSLGLVFLGLKKKETVCLLSRNRPEWAYSDFAILSAGGITVPIYQTLLSPDVAYIIGNSEAKIIIVEDQSQLDKVMQVKDNLPNLKKIIVMERVKDDNPLIMSFEDVCSLGVKKEEEEPGIFEKNLSSINLDDVATYVYTSGTTGPPKGSIITHSNIMFICRSVRKIIPSDDSNNTISYLPLAHIYERIGNQFFGTYTGGRTSYAESFDALAQNLQEEHPTILLAVPRVFEKVYERILTAVKEEPKLKRSIFNWSLEVGKEVSQLRQMKKGVPLPLKIKYSLAEKLVFSKIKKSLGGRVKWIVSAAAPLSVDIAHFFDALGILILEGYGLTETSAPATLNTPDWYKIGTVGRPIPGVEIKIADDGEILIKGGGVFQGYFKNPEATKEALKDGWFYSGDVGELDKDGFLKITDRKKDIIITAGGKNIAPQNIENHFKNNLYLSEVLVIGDKRPYLTALITLNKEEITKFAQEKGISFKDFSQLIKHPEIKSLVESIVEEKNKSLARFETIKKFTILDKDFTIESGELTPTLKVKRKFATQKFKEQIMAMY